MDGHEYRWRWAQHRNALTIYCKSDGRVSLSKYFTQFLFLFRKLWILSKFVCFFFLTLSFRNQFTIIPILVGSISSDVEATYGELLAPYLADSQNLFVISSDFCHWGKRFSYTYYDESCGPIHKSIERLDKNVSQMTIDIRLFIFLFTWNEIDWKCVFIWFEFLGNGYNRNIKSIIIQWISEAL